MYKYLFLLLPFVVGCTKSNYIVQDNGKEVVCHSGYTERCGLMLWDCENNASYRCQTNVKEIR